MKTEKQEIRRQFIQKRSSLSPQKRDAASRVITEKVVEHPYFQNAENIYCYVDYHEEVCTRFLMERAWKLGKNVWVPKVEGKEMEFYRIHSMEELTSGAYGILEPEPLEKADGRCGFMIMPGTAFDRERRRIGYGGGFYDKYLAKHPGLHTIAVAFEVQISRTPIPAEETDLAPEILMTEEKQYEI